MLTKGAIGNLINRYKAVLTKCNLINVFGSLAVASIMVAGSAQSAIATESGKLYYKPASFDFSNYPESEIEKNPLFSRAFKLLLATNNNESESWPDIEDFFNDEELANQLERTLLVGHEEKNQNKSNYSININEEVTNIIFGGRYSGNLQNLKGAYSDVNSVEITMNPNAVIYGELNGGGIAAGWREDNTNEHGTEIALRGNKNGVKSASKVTTTTININGGALYPIGEENNEIKGAGGYTYIRGGGSSMNGGRVRIDNATINISGSAGNTNNENGHASIPHLPYTSIMGGGTNGGYYATINNSEAYYGSDYLLGEESVHDGYQKIGWYFAETDDGQNVEFCWYNKTNKATINIDKMAYRKNILDNKGAYSAKEISWLGSTIFAGGDNSYVKDSTINLTDSSVGTVFSGGECYGVTGKTTINLTNSIIFDFYSGAKDENSDGAGLPHKTQHDGLVGSVTVNMAKNSAICSYSGQIFDKEAATYTPSYDGGKVTSIKWNDTGNEASNFKSWIAPHQEGANKGTPFTKTLTFTADGTNNRLYLKDGFTSEEYLASAQRVMDGKVGEGKIQVIRTGKSDRELGSPEGSSTGYSLRSNTSHVIEKNSFSAGYADVTSGNLSVEKSDNNDGTTIHLTGIAEVKDYYHNPTDEGVDQIFNTDYATRELLTLKGSSTAIENIAIGDGCTLRLGNETEHTGGKLSNSVSLGDATSNGTIDVVGGRFTLNDVEANAGDTIIVGSANSSATLILGDEADLGGATVFLDPAWTGIPERDVIENATHMIRTSGKVDANYIVGQNSVLTLADGMTAADAEKATYENFKALAEKGLHWGEDGITAALSLLAPHSITDGMSITVDGSKQHQGAATPAVTSSGSSSDAYFAKNSLLMIDKNALGDGTIPALSGNNLTIEDGAKIAMPNAELDKSYIIADFDNTSRLGNQTGWSGDNILINKVVNGEASIDADGNLVITATEGDINPAYLPKNAIDAWRKNHGDGVGSDFFSAALATDVDDALSVNTVNEVAQASVTAGVQNTALRLADAASETVLNHLSLGKFDSGNSVHADGTDFWATPMYGNTYTNGMSASEASVRGNYGGIAFGADTQVGDVLGGKVRVGAALNGGGGKSETKGSATRTQNDYNFGGINLYAGWNNGNLNIIAGLGYGIGDNEVAMTLPSSMKIGKAKADIDTSVITADLRAEYQLKTNWLDILPHAGVRYTALRTDSHDLKVNGSVLNSVDAETQHIVQFPVGVTLTKNIDAWGWNVKPQVDVSIIPAVGDKDMNTKVRFSGVNAVDSIDTRIMDSTSWSGMVGVQAEKGNLTFGLNYGIQASSHETDQKVQASIGWKF